ncbi:IclR family transcriptional regulator [Rhizobium sp. RM]|uniref:IclR family transcriptional regulator n=1 Tax=Rhizobium sp. RM TaxID=2748079 RepID=UPI0015B719CA|nr:IclR family transcriptional regulator [Rhizobium sp. RM]NWJ25278.1 IclR family transcriptional regulator [Rhizobium sp. RM]
MSKRAASSLALESSQSNVPALRRSVDILDMVAGAEGALSAADIARLLSLPKSTTHGLLKVLVELELLRKLETGRFIVGAHPTRWTKSFDTEFDIVSKFYALVSERSDFRVCTITLTVLDGNDAVSIGSSNADRSMGLTFPVGTRLPACFSASGKVLLSELSEIELHSMLPNGLPAPTTLLSTRTMEQLVKELAETRERGFCFEQGQVRESVSSIAAPVRDPHGRTVAAVCASTFSCEIGPQNIDRIREMVVEFANRLTG